MKTYTLKDAPNGVGIRGQRPSIISTNVSQPAVMALVSSNPKLLNEPAAMIFTVDLSDQWPEDMPEGAYAQYRTNGIVFASATGMSGNLWTGLAVAFILHEIQTSIQIGYEYFDEDQGDGVFVPLIDVTTEATGLTKTEGNFDGTAYDLGNLIHGSNYSSGRELSLRGIRRWFTDGTFKFAAFAPGMALTAIDRTEGTDTISVEFGKATGVDSITVKRRQGGGSSANPYQISVKKTGQSRTEDSNMNGLTDLAVADIMLVATPVNVQVQALGDPDALHLSVFNGVTMNLPFRVPRPANEEYKDSTAQDYDTPHMLVELDASLYGAIYLSDATALFPTLYYDSLETYYRFAKGTDYNVAVQTLAAGSNTVSSADETTQINGHKFAMYINSTGSDVTVTITPTQLTAGKIMYKVGTLIPDSNTEDLTPVIPGFTYQSYIDTKGTSDPVTVTVPDGMTLIVDPQIGWDGQAMQMSTTIATVTVGN
jgi:hypothetical protein